MRNSEEYFIERYGEEFLLDLEKARTRPLHTLSDVANKYGFTREWIRQLFTRIYGKPFMHYKRIKSKELRSEIENLGCKYDPIQRLNYIKENKNNINLNLQAQNLFISRCNKLGYTVETILDRKASLKINENSVIIRAGSNSRRLSPHSYCKYYYFNIESESLNNIDFIILYLADKELFYIVPSEIVKNLSKKLYLRDGKSRRPELKSGFSEIAEEYKERWELLK